jgi:aspartyl-tRNA(Asn)/glutamyl-tRNA(Gln) amidotransferase subunit C
MLTAEQVEKIATLSRLALTEEEKATFTQQLSSILDYVGQLKELNTEGVEPLQHIAPLENVFGPDEVRPCPPEERAELLNRFPEREGDLLKVKAVFS